MTRVILLIGILLFVVIGGFMLKTGDDKINRAQKNMTNNMKITSPAFEHNQSIPKKYTCDGDNINPSLVFSHVPLETKSLVLIMEDPDVSKTIKPDGMWDHWLVWDMLPIITKISEGGEPQGIIGKNSGGRIGYAGPCPPDREHRYFFKLYALDIASLPVRASDSKAEIMKATEGHILAQAELMGRYER